MSKSKKTTGMISPETTGIFLTSGLIVVVIVSIFSSQPLLLGGALTTILFLLVLFLYKPLVGIALLFTVRTAIDKIGTGYSIDITRNISLNANSLLGIMAIGMVFFFLISQKKKFNRSFKVVMTTWILYLTASLVSIFFSVDPGTTFQELVRLFSIFSIFILGYLFASSKKPALGFRIVLYSSIIPLSVGIYQALTESGMGRVAGLKNRLHGTFSDPNSFAAFLVIIIAILVYFMINKSKKVSLAKKWKEFSLISFLIIILLATFSRGGWLALLVFGSILSAFKSPKILLLLMGGFILITLTVEPVQDRVEDVYNPPITSSVYWRFQQWDRMYRLFQKNPWTGYGAGTEVLVHEREFGFNAGNPYTHNDLLKNALETGVFGAISYALLLLATLATLLFGYFRSQKAEVKNLFLIIFVLFLAEIGFSMTSNILRSTAIQWLIWFLVGSTLALHYRKKP